MEVHEHYDRQHQDLRVEDGIEYGDTMEGVDKDYAAKLTTLNMVTMAGMAGAPPFPANVEASGAVQPSAKLTWETPENADKGERCGRRRERDSRGVPWSGWTVLKSSVIPTRRIATPGTHALSFRLNAMFR